MNGCYFFCILIGNGDIKFLFHGHNQFNLVKGIRRLGAQVHEITAYHTVLVKESIAAARRMLASGEIEVITFTSSSAVANLVTSLQDEPWPANQAKIACIGPKTAEAAVKAGLKVDILASEQTIPGLVGAIEEYFKEET